MSKSSAPGIAAQPPTHINDQQPAGPQNAAGLSMNTSLQMETALPAHSQILAWRGGRDCAQEEAKQQGGILSELLKQHSRFTPGLQYATREPKRSRDLGQQQAGRPSLADLSRIQIDRQPRAHDSLEGLQPFCAGAWGWPGQRLPRPIPGCHLQPASLPTAGPLAALGVVVASWLWTCHSLGS